MKIIDRLYATGLLVAAATAAGCATGGAVNPTRDRSPSPAVSLYVRNDNWHDMKIYFVPDTGGAPVRVGTVTSLTSAVIPLRGHINSEINRGNARFLLRPLASRDSYLTHHVLMGAGDRLELIVANRLAHSTLVLR